jgi:hypothetical protein
MKDRTRVAILFGALAAIYLLSAFIDPCDGHSCPPGGDASVSALSAD